MVGLHLLRHHARSAGTVLDQLFYVGPLVRSLGGADISWIVGFGVASLLYLAGAKRFVLAGPARARQGSPAADPVAS